MENTINESEKKKRFKLKMPGAFMILFILTVVAVIATWVIPLVHILKLYSTLHPKN
ncbi:hypothetical protein ACVPOS_09840 [Staphylococcus aureus]